MSQNADPNKAVQQAVDSYFDRTGNASANSLEIWTSTLCSDYDGDPWQFAECCYELPNVTVEPQWPDDPTNDPIVHCR